MKDLELWKGISVSSTAADVQRLFPNATGSGPIDLGFHSIGEWTFSASWYYWRGSEPKVMLTSADLASLAECKRASQHIIALLNRKYGKGRPRIEIDGVLRKAWDKRLVRVQMTSVWDDKFPVISIEYFRPLYRGENLFASEIDRDLSNI